MRQQQSNTMMNYFLIIAINTGVADTCNGAW